MERGRDPTIQTPAPPKIEDDPEKLPSALTFFVTNAQRRALLRALSAWSNDRTGALLMALGIQSLEQEHTKRGRRDG